MTNIRSVQLKNFRGFKDHTVALDQLSILVGQNNAGKSTLIDALRLLAVAIRKTGQATYIPAPEWLGDHAKGMGFKSSFETVDFDFGNVHHNYEVDAPAQLQIFYTNKSRVTLWLGRNSAENFTQVTFKGQGLARTRTEAAEADLRPILVMPPISPLARHELRIAPARVREFMYGRLSSRHFRNQLHQLVPSYRQWKQLLETTWPTVRVESFEDDCGDSGREFSLILRDTPFASEAAQVGSGLQAWMQILWFICRADKNSFIVLDEPDVFLHADMQRKIVKLIAAHGFSQVAIATHSAEIISDVDPSTISVIRKRDRYSRKPGKKKQVQEIIDSLGSRHNVQLSKLASARRFVLYEGDDQKYLSEIALALGDSFYQKMANVPHFDIKGVTNWHQAIGAARTLHAASDGDIPAHLIIDRDFRSDDEIAKISKECGQHHLLFHAWSKKEIENFFVDPRPLSRILRSRTKKDISIEVADSIIENACAQLKQNCIETIADKLVSDDPKLMPSTAMKRAKTVIAEMLKVKKLRDVVSGKKLIREISKATQSKWGTQINAMALCREIKIEELSPEIVTLTRQLSS